MNEYHKIQTVYKRDPATKHKTLLEGDFSLPEFDYLKNNEWVFTEKIDGTNIRVLIAGGKAFGYKGKTDNANNPAFLTDVLNSIFQPLEKSIQEAFGDGTATLYGEGYGQKIQSGGKYRQDHGFVLFDVKIGEYWLHRPDVEDIASKLGLEVAPVIGSGTLQTMVGMAKEGFKSKWGDFFAEGIVARPKVELKTRSGDRIITKIKYKDFLK